MTEDQRMAPTGSTEGVAAPDAMLVLEGSMPGDEELIAGVVERMMAALTGVGCIQGDEFEIELALTEALANGVRHGCQCDAGRRVHYRVDHDGAGGMTIVVRDPGPGYDPDAVPDPLAGENLFSHHGRGLFLIRRIMDEVDLSQGGAEITMRKLRRQV